MVPTLEATCNGQIPDGAAVDDLHAFRLAVTQAAATMDTPPYNTPPAKLQKAMDLVLGGKVTAHEDGLYTVQGSSRSYEIGDACPCPQGMHSKTKWCKHMVATELWKRTQERLYNGDGNANGHAAAPEYRKPESDYATVPYNPEWHTETPRHHWTDVLAPICHTVKYVIDSVEHVTVIRGDDLQEVLAQVKELTAMIKKGREHEAVPTEDIPYCEKHKVHFERHSNHSGAWYSHKTADGWCRYKV